MKQKGLGRARRFILAGAMTLVIALQMPTSTAQEARQRPALTGFNSVRPAVAPIVLCIDDKAAAGGQPTDLAYAKAAANGFRSILTLRSSKDGVNTLRERLIVEKHQMRYFNLPVLALLPSHKQIDEFLGWVRDPSNHPMLANCAFIERIAPYMMIFHLVEQGWSEERAVEDASRSGLRRGDLQALARGYLKSRANKSKPKARS